MAGEMTKKDLEVGGDWWEVKQSLLDLANGAGFDQSTVEPFDQYQGPKCVLKKNGLVVGSLWVREFGYLVVVENNRKSESKEIGHEYSELYNFILETWKDWNSGYNPEIIEETLVQDAGDRIIVSLDGSEKVYKKYGIGDEISCVVENFGKVVVEYKHKYYVEED